MDPQQQYREALDWIHGIGRFGIKPGLERVSALLERLGNPHHRLKFLHIGGTNGKGSTAAMAASILQTAGYRIALFTSPYLLSFTNRMALNGEEITAAELVEIVDRARPLVSEISADPQFGQMTEFEVVTALALAFFARKQPDLVVFEVGLGGRLDATNVVTPLVSVITNVSLDHTEILGNTVPAIAREKAGIIKPGVPLVTAAADVDTLAVLTKRCLWLDSPLYRVLPLSWTGLVPEKSVAFSRREITAEGQLLNYRGLEHDFDSLFIPLRGSYQAANAATALAAIELLSRQGFAIDGRSLRRGLAETAWPGRMELLSREPLLIMDGAHNPAAMQQLAESVPEYFSYRRLILVLGVMADKDIEAMVRAVVPLAAEVVLTRPSLSRAADPRDLSGPVCRVPGFAGAVHLADDPEEALKLALKLASPADAVLVTGSLYTISDLRASWMATLK